MLVYCSKIKQNPDFPPLYLSLTGHFSPYGKSLMNVINARQKRGHF